MEAKPDKVYLLTIPGRLIGLNQYVDYERASKYSGAKVKKEMQNLIRWYIRRDLRGLHFSGPVVMAYKWIEKAKTRDKDNIAFAKKFIQDALVCEGVLDNDGWDDIESFMDEFAIDKNKARVEVRMWLYAG